MTLNNIISTFLIMLFIGTSNALSANSSDNQLIHLQADSIQYNFKQGIIYYRGHVHAVRELTHLYANTMIVFYYQKKIHKIVAEGTPAIFSSRQAQEKDLLEAYASKIIYFPTKAEVELIDKVKVQQRSNQFTGPRLRYDMKKQRVISVTNQKSKAQLVIEPYNTFTAHKT